MVTEKQPDQISKRTFGWFPISACHLEIQRGRPDCGRDGEPIGIKEGSLGVSFVIPKRNVEIDRGLRNGSRINRYRKSRLRLTCREYPTCCRRGHGKSGSLAGGVRVDWRKL